MKNKKCVIIGGASINNYETIKKYLTPEDYFIFCDCGLNHVEKLNIKPDLIIGDFDSHEMPSNYDIKNIIILPHEKDDTDTMFAVKEGIKRGFEEFLLIGVIGERLDHSLVNIYSLLYLEKNNKRAMILDDYSEIEIVSPGKIKTISDKYKYFSLVNISGVSKGIYITGAKYNLENAEIINNYQYATSNEVLQGQEAKIKLTQGNLLLIKIL